MDCMTKTSVARVVRFIGRQFNQIYEGGYTVFMRKAILFFKLVMTKGILFVIYFVPAFILKMLNFQFPAFDSRHIGHLLAEPDCYLKEVALGRIPRRRVVMLASKKLAANRAALSYWRQYFSVIENNILAKLLHPLTWHPLSGFNVYKYVVAKGETAGFATIQALWSDRAPLLRISSEDSLRGQQALEELGVKANDWFVCIHSRDDGYRPSDKGNQSYRNSHIDDYNKAVEYILSQGGLCIKMGDATSLQHAPRIRGLIDYAHYSNRKDWLDLYISARSLFFLGDNSGPSIMAQVFGTRLAVLNMAPMSTATHFGCKDIGIPKLYKEIKSGRLLQFGEIFESPLANFRYSSDFETAGVELVNNTPEDILELAIEQLQVIKNPMFVYTEEDETLQRRFKDLFKPEHYAYGSASRIGRAFLKRYQHLLP